ncbi:STAS domain-containing protein [Nocardioides litoris]|uniref:STAS domain-containing protein n=1 Tax=Nocardioides litoris TaxID=1926648 RepID=UPI0011208DE8|nr:STAS domain-containing protein [Nocardioides litoris]
MFDQPLSFTESGDVLSLHGSVDEFALVDLREHLADTLAQGRVRYVEMSDVDLLPSAAIGILAAARADALKAGTPVDLVAADGTFAARVLRSVGIPFLAQVPPSPER